MATSHGGKRRINTTAAGYGHQHQMLRRQVAPTVEAGLATCARCGEPITPWQAWHLDHADDRQGYVGVSHARCNTRAGALKGNRMRRERWASYQEDATARAIAWAERENAYWQQVEAERQQAERRPARPAIY